MDDQRASHARALLIDPRRADVPITRAWLSCMLLGLAVTLLVVLVPSVRFSYRNPGLHVVLDTVEAMIGLLVAYVMYGRFRSTREVRVLALVLGLSTLGLSNLFFSAIAQVATGSEALNSWAPLANRVTGTVAITAAAFLPTSVRVGRRAGFSIVASFVVAIFVCLAVLFANATNLPTAIDASIDPGASRQPLIVGHPVLLTAQVTMMVLFATAAGAFLRIAREQNDPVYGWFGAASVLAAFSRLNYFLFPSLYSDFVYVGDVLRLGFYVLLLVGATREIRSYWQSRANAEVLEVRNALARNLHDGLAQELVYVAAQTTRLARIEAERADLDSLRDAADRAVAEARRAIAVLSHPVDERLSDVIAETAEEEARRAGVSVRLALDDDAQVPPEKREGLVRITREAVKRAVRSRNASLVTVALTMTDGLRLTVEDDGIASGTASEPGEATRLSALHDRARAIGAELHISDAANGANQLMVVIR